MQQKVLVTKFNYSMSTAEYEETVAGLAQAFAEVPGCLWKIWLLDAEKKEAGAVYLFQDDASLQNFKASPLVAGVLAHPALSNFDFRETDILQEVSEITHAPLFATPAAHSF